MNIKPLNDWAVIVPSEAEARTAGGLFIPDAAKEKPAEGVVEAIGPGAFEEEEKFGKKKKEKKERKFIPTTVKPGDRVLYERFAGQKITLGNLERLLVRERDILGLVIGRSSGGGQKPLQLPATTSTVAETSLATLAMKSIVAAEKQGTGKTKKQGTGSRGQGAGKAKKQGQGSRGQGAGKAKKQGKAKAKKQGTGKTKKQAPGARVQGPKKPKKQTARKTTKKKSGKKK